MSKSIDDLKSEINKRGGIGRTNRFNVFFTPPTQALINIDLGAIIGSLIRGDFNKNQLITDPRSLTLLCESATLPSRALGTSDYTATGKHSEKRVQSYADGDVSFSFLVTNDFYIKRMVDDWQEIIVNSETNTLGYKKNYTCDVVIQQLNQENEVVYGAKLINAFPSSIGAMQLTSAAGGESKIEITMQYDRFVVEDTLSSSLSAIRSAIPGKLFG